MNLDDALALLPAAGDRFRDLEAGIWDCGLEHDLLVRVRSRIAQLLGDHEVAAPEPPVSPDATTAAVLRFTEQYVLDAHGMSDGDCVGVVAALGDAGAAALTVAVAVFEASSRSRVALGGFP